MTRHSSATRRRLSRIGMPLAFAALLAQAACGGGEFASADSATVAPLLAADGSVLPSSAEAQPTDPNVRTNQRRYATRAQAAALEEALQGEVLEVQIDCCGAAMVEQAINIAFGIQAAHNFSDDVPVLVQGRDLRTAAGVVDRLAANGMTRVWLVTQ